MKKPTVTQSSTPLSEEQAFTKFIAEFPFNDYPAMFPLANSLQRNFTVILGPTNSGKTHQALSALVKAESGAYLGPLRLLALEGQERITSAGVPCSLKTGEERIDVYGAAHVASTVEMADFKNQVDTAIIDEVQMLNDPDRGWAWTAAICGMPAKNIFLLGSPDIAPTIERLLKRIGAQYTIVRTKRLRPLEAEPTCVPIEKIRPGDALIVFSRKEVFIQQELLGQRGISSAVVYGALGPEVRRAEADRYRKGEAQVLIATDAIGMGLNLPIRRVVFADSWKYNGEEDELLSPMLSKQIAGRAGRAFTPGVPEDEIGLFAGIDEDVHMHVVDMVKQVTPLSVFPVYVVPTPLQLAAFAKSFSITDPVEALLQFGNRFLQVDNDIFVPGWSQERLERLEELKPFVDLLGMATLMAVAQAPVPNGEWVESFYWAAIRAMARDKPMTLWHHSDGGEQGAELALQTISGAEAVYHVASLYSWLHRAFGPRFPEYADSMIWRKKAADALITLLQARAKSITMDPKNSHKKLRRGVTKKNQQQKSVRSF